MKSYFIASTDAGMGKTYLITSVLRELTAAGFSVAGFKPVACGERTEARLMREAMGQPTLSLELLNPVYLRSSADPMMAAQLERKSLSVDILKEAYQALSSQYEYILVEGCNGWLTPLAEGVSMEDVADALQLPVILVTENRCGAAGQVALTAAAIKRCGLECAGVVLNHPGEEWDTAAVTNKELIEKTTGLPVLASLIAGEDIGADFLAQLR